MDYLQTKELYHHGIKGQKWGVRRYQYEDGSLTEEGKRRRRVGDGKPVSTVQSPPREIRVKVKSSLKRNKTFNKEENQYETRVTSTSSSNGKTSALKRALDEINPSSYLDPDDPESENDPKIVIGKKINQLAADYANLCRNGKDKEAANAFRKALGEFDTKIEFLSEEGKDGDYNITSAKVSVEGAQNGYYAKIAVLKDGSWYNEEGAYWNKMKEKTHYL